MTAVWTFLALTAVLWPSRVIGPLDGIPLDAPADAIVIGMVLIALLWFDGRFLRTPFARTLIVVLLVWKAGTTLTATQQGLCLRSSTEPFSTNVNAIDIVEPFGALRSWDLRADWRAQNPTCTAIVTRSFATLPAFPAWFLNIVDAARRPRDVRMTLHGYFSTRQPHRLSVMVGEDMTVERRVDGQTLAEPAAIDAGTHEIDLSMKLTGDRWRLEPALDDASLWRSATTFVAEPTTFDRVLAPWAWLVAPAIIVTLVAGWLWHIASLWQPGARVVAAVVALAAAAAALGVQTPSSMLQRSAGLLGLVAPFVPLPPRLRNLRGAFLLVGVPWLAFFAAYQFAEIGRFSAYSAADDWLTYQAAGYRIVMHGYWFEGGTTVFGFQPLYRWLSGLLHVVFGDSSVGEFYWDAACLLSGALLAFWLVRARAGVRWGLAAAALTLATLLTGTPWWFVGRGLSEISAAGFSFLAMFCLLRGRLGRTEWIAGAGVFAVLMFYARLNHLLYPVFMPALLLSLRTPSIWSEIWQRVRRVSPAFVLTFWGVFAAGVLLFVVRTWWYTGVFSLFYGTSLPYNDTGLRLSTAFQPAVWRTIAHSVASLVTLNDPPRVDPRALLVPAGAIAACAGLLQVPGFRGIPAAMALIFIGGACGGLFVHGHAYPGRFSVHLVPLGVALSLVASSSVVRARTASGVNTRRIVARLKSRAT